MEVDARLRQSLRNELGALAAVPENADISRSADHRQDLLIPLFAGQARYRIDRDRKAYPFAIRDAVNRSSRKPFHWGGLAAIKQLAAIAQTLHGLPVEMRQRPCGNACPKSIVRWSSTNGSPRTSAAHIPGCDGLPTVYSIPARASRRTIPCAAAPKSAVRWMPYWRSSTRIRKRAPRKLRYSAPGNRSGMPGRRIY